RFERTFRFKEMTGPPHRRKNAITNRSRLNLVGQVSPAMSTTTTVSPRGRWTVRIERIRLDSILWRGVNEKAEGRRNPTVGSVRQEVQSQLCFWQSIFPSADPVTGLVRGLQ